MTDSSSSSSSSSDCDNGAFMKPVAPLVLKKPQGKRQRRAEWRHNPDGTYNNKPTDPDYFRTYYHLNLSCPTACSLCGRKVAIQKMARHQATKVCGKNRLVPESISI